MIKLKRLVRCLQEEYSLRESEFLKCLGISPKGVHTITFENSWEEEWAKGADRPVEHNTIVIKIVRNHERWNK